MPLDGTLPASLNRDSREFPAGAQIADFESQQPIDVYEAEREASVDGGGAEGVREGSDRAHDLYSGVSNRKQGRR